MSVFWVNNLLISFGKFRHSPTFNKFLQTLRSEEISYHTSTNSVSSLRKVYTELAINLKGVYKIQYRKICRRRLRRGGFAPGERRLQGSRETERAERQPSALYLFYINAYIPIYIFTRTHTYLTFFPFHIVYSPYVRRGQLACVRPPFEPNVRSTLLFTCF